MKLRIILSILVAVWLLPGCAWVKSLGEGTPAEKITMGPVFQDGVVLQRNVKVPVWGWCEPGRTVTVEILAQRVVAVADSSGRWEAVLEPMKACGPVLITITGKNTFYVKDVMVGEVWLLAGGTEVEASAGQAETWAKESRWAGQFRLRLFRMDASSGSGKWVQSRVETAKDFSACGFYLGRRMQHELNCPVGIIQLSGKDIPIVSWLAPDGVFFKGKIAPLLPFAFLGMIWNHGEGETAQVADYRQKLLALIKGWRQVWGFDFPFMIVQLSNRGAQWPLPQESRLAEFREAQMAVAGKNSNTSCIVSIDLGKDKPGSSPSELADRILRMMEMNVYRDYFAKVALPHHTGPAYDKMTVEGGKIRIHFRDVGKGLVSKDGGWLRHFAVAGKDGKFHWAVAAIDGEDVTVWSGLVPKPVAVRYAWADNPLSCNLFNKDGLPAAPFRTDNPQPSVTPEPVKAVAKPVVSETSTGFSLVCPW